MTEYATIQDLIRQSCRPEYKLGNGAWGTTYSLAHIPGLENYVMRMAGGGVSGSTVEETLARLNATTNLYPRQGGIMGGLNLGQGLLETYNYSHGKPLVSFLVRQHGLSIHEWLEQNMWLHEAQGHDHSRIRASIDLYDAILATAGKGNPFAPLVAAAAPLKESGYLSQLDKRNIVWDGETGRLALVDQLNDAGRFGNAWTLQKCFTTSEELGKECDPQLWAQLQEKEGAVKTLIIDAERRHEVAKAHGTLPPPPFVKIFPKHTSAIALGDPPKALIEQLHTLYNEAKIAPAL